MDQISQVAVRPKAISPKCVLDLTAVHTEQSDKILEIFALPYLSEDIARDSVSDFPRQHSLCGVEIRRTLRRMVCGGIAVGSQYTTITIIDETELPMC